MSTDEKSPDEKGEQPQEGDAPYLARRRMPFDARGQGRSPGVTAAGILYGIATAACFGLAGYMAFAEQRPLASVAVIAPLAGGIWFLIRMLMVLRPQVRKD